MKNILLHGKVFSTMVSVKRKDPGIFHFSEREKTKEKAREGET